MDTLKLDDKYAINPWCRLRNEQDHVLVSRADAGPPFRMAHVAAIVVALCDGRRTVAEIAGLAEPLVDSPPNTPVAEKAAAHVCAIINRYSRNTPGTKDEHQPGEQLLVPVAELGKFAPLQPPQYEAQQFYPRHAFPKSSHDIALRERVPTDITWHLTSACSTDCQYCYLGRRRILPEDLLPRRRMRELVDEAARIGVPALRPAGGDVILYPHLFDFLDAVSAHGMSPMRIATKSFVSREMAARLAQYSLVHELQFSMDSTVPDAADYLVQTPGFCARTMRSIDNALQAGLRVVCKCVITPYNIATVPRLYRELRRQGVETVRLATYCRSGYHHRDGLFNHAEDYDWLDKQLDLLRGEFPDDSIYYQNGRPCLVAESCAQREVLWKKRVRCSAGRTSMLICADGKVIPCEQLPEIEELFVGDVRYQSIEEVWNGSKLDEITIHFPRERYRATICHDCDEFEECHLEKGYCIRDTYIQYGTVWQASPLCPKNDRFVRVM